MTPFFRQFSNPFLALVLVLPLFLTGGGMSITQAQADFRICNDTDSLVGASLGYREDGAWISEGWFQVPAESCSSLIEGDLSSRFYYVYAEDADKGGQWRGDVFLCTTDTEFRIEGVDDCFKRGFVKTGFFEIDTGNRANWMVRLTEQSQSAPEQ
ncbi:MAG: DUF1036 domain-containing protein [Pseudomonadota bacterium]